jgi:leucyl/phenylalanyl-tRNA--protein transferase
VSVLTPHLLLKAYAIGVFPMAEGRRKHEILFVEPERRGILPFERFRLSRRLARTIRSRRFETRVDTAFAATVAGCAAPTPGRRDTWINPEIERLYAGLFDLGFAHSVETWRDGRLAGGLYGVALGGAFFGESMFSRESDASKVALVDLVARLKRGGFVLLDTQFLTAHLERFGAVEVPKDEYKRLLAEAMAVKATFPKE